MFKNAATLVSYKKYLMVLRASLKRLQKMQKSRNKGGPQGNDVMLTMRYFPKYSFGSKADKKPKPIFVVATKSMAKQVTDAMTAGAEKRAKETKTSAKGSTVTARGFLFWNEAEATFHFLVRGAIKVVELKLLVKRAGLKDRVELGEANDDIEALAAQGEAQVAELDAGTPEEPEEDVPAIDESDEGEDGDGDEAGEGGEDGETPVAAEAQPDTATGSDPREAAWTVSLGRFEPVYLKAVAGAAPPRAAQLRTVMAFAQAKAEAGDFDKALTSLKHLAGLIRDEPAAGPHPDGGSGAALATWQAARDAVVTQIRAVARKVADTRDPDARGVLIELESIVKNLTPRPDGPHGVAELERYLRTDDVISAAEEVPAHFGTLSIRSPLLLALDALKS